MKARGRPDDTLSFLFKGYNSGIVSSQYSVTKHISSLVSIHSQIYVIYVPIAPFSHLPPFPSIFLC